MAKELAIDATRKSFEHDERSVQRSLPNLNQFTKYDGETSPEHFVQTMCGELDLMQINTEPNRKKYLPLLLKGKTSYYAESLRCALDWPTAKGMFL